MLLEANAAKTVDFDKLAAFDKARAPLSFSVDRNDPRYFSNFNQWKQDSVDVGVGTRSVNIRTDVFKHAAHRVPFNEAVFTPHSYSENPMYTPTPDKLPKPMSPAMALAAGLGIMGDLALGVLAVKSKNRAAISSWLLLQAPIVNGCQTAMATPSAEVTVAPTITPKVEITTTPQPQVSTENAPGGPEAPTAIAASSSWPSPESFPKTLTNREVIPQGDIKAENVLDQFGDIDYTLRYYGESATLGFVETTTGQYQWAIQATTNGGKSALWPENAEGQLFSHPSTANDQDTAAATPVLGYETITPKGIGEDYTLGLESANGVFTYVARSTKDGSLLASFFVTPSLEGEWKMATQTSTEASTEVAKFSIDSLGLSPEVAAALKKHAGLEASIVAEAGGFTTQITYWDAEHNLVTEKVNVDPSVLTENVQSKNEFGNTPVMVMEDGQKLYWSQEHKGWFKIKMNPDINNPTFVPQEYTDVVVRALIAEYSQPFSQAAVDWWNKTSGLSVGFQYLTVNANTGENTKFAFLTNLAMSDDGTTAENSPIIPIDAWFSTEIAGEIFQYSPTKWLDPVNPRAPSGDEWKIFLSASGQEIMGDPENRAKFDDLWAKTSDPTSNLQVVPIVKAESGFFNDTNGLVTFSTAQPSLAKLIPEVTRKIGAMQLPSEPEYTFGEYLNQIFGMLTPTETSFNLYYADKKDPIYKDNFFPSDFQTIIYPSLIVTR